MLLAALQLRHQDENIDAFRSETNRARILDLTHVVERDLRNAGGGLQDGGIVAWVAGLPTTSTPLTILDFYTVVDTAATASAVRLQYRIALEDSTIIDGAMTPLYELRRVQLSPHGEEELSRSPASLLTFGIRVLDGQGNDAGLPEEARAVHVRAHTISPFGRDRLTQDSRWETTVWPVNLQPRS